jgi:glycosyltransferase involved in cell wall biosynthesis
MRSNRPIRILEFRYSDGPGGGPEKTILLGAARSDPQKFAVTVGYVRNVRDDRFDTDRKAEQLGVDFVEFPQRNPLDRMTWTAVRRVVRERKIDIVHAHDYKTNLIALWLARTTGVIAMSTSHGWTGHSRRERWLYYPADKRLIRFLDAAVAVSSEIRDELVSAGVRRDRVRVLLNGIDPQSYRREQSRVAAARAKFGIDPADFVIGSAGRVETQKRFDLLIRAFSCLRRGRPRVRLLIAGEGSLRPELGRQVQALGIADSCRLFGHCTDIRDFYHAIDLYAQSSDYEGTPNVVLEAMAFEVPVVATNVGGTSELIDDQVHGLIVPPGDPGRLAGAIEEAMNDPENASRRATAARRRIETELSFEARCSKLEEIYERLFVSRQGRENLAELSVS